MSSVFDEMLEVLELLVLARFVDGCLFMGARPFGKGSRLLIGCPMVEDDADIEGDVTALGLNGGTGGLDAVIGGLVEGFVSSANSGLR